MKNRIISIVLIIVGLIALFLIRTGYSDYNLKKAVSACVFANKKTSKSFDLKKAKKFCEEEIKKRNTKK